MNLRYKKLGRPQQLKKAKNCTVCLEEEHLKLMEWLGEGNVSQGIRTLIEKYKEKERKKGE